MKSETKNIRWLHLSDFHVGKDAYGQRQLFKYILEHVEKQQAPDFVFITGDIAQAGRPEHYSTFGQEFLLPLEELVGKECKIIFVPGNHDVDRNKEKFITRSAIKEKSSRFLDPTVEGVNDRHSLLPRFKEYQSLSSAFLDHDWLASDDGFYVHKSKRKRLQVGILGVNTAWFSEDESDFRNLTPGKAIVEKGLEDISETDLKIVLGHHPIDWFETSDAKAIRALFGKNNVIYLHGHLHENQSRIEEGAGSLFLNIQTGAAFQDREGDIWVNGLTWGEWNPTSASVELEPFQWSKQLQEWVPDMQAYPSAYRIGDSTRFSVPYGRGAEPVKRPSRKGEIKRFKPPQGWELITPEVLDNIDRNPSEEIVLSYFDGRVPNMGLALSKQIPRRDIVGKMVDYLNNAKSCEQPSINMLLGAGGEGKTTAFFQIIEGLVESKEDWKVLFRRGEGARLSKKMIAELPEKGVRWLIASDDADLIADDLYQVAYGLQSIGADHVHFLLACRHTEWRSTKVSPPQWERLPGYREESLRGLSEKDAEQIVDAWASYDSKGLGRLSGLTKQEAVRQLVSETRSEKSVDDGAFLGALLRLRFGDQLKNHVKKLLDRLYERKVIPESDATLLDAFAYVAAMHAENKLYLSKLILCDVLDVKPQQLRSKVLWPLGEEAAADVAGDMVLTRHRAIAEAAIDILVNTTYYDVEITDVYKDLVKASRRLYSIGEFVPNLAEWKYLSDYFFDNKGDYSLGISLAKAVLEVDKNDSHARVKLAQLFRRAGQSEQALRVFRDAPMTELRGFFHEWGVAEGVEGSNAISAYLDAVALSDETERKPPDNKTAAFCLSGFAFSCERMFNSFNNPEYIEGCGAACQLGLALPNLNGKDVEFFNRSASFATENGYEKTNLSDAIKNIKTTVVEASKQLESRLPEWMHSANDLTFEGLARLVRIDNT